MCSLHLVANQHVSVVNNKEQSSISEENNLKVKQ